MELWLAKSRVSITVSKVPAIIYAIAYAIMNSMENLRFGKEVLWRVIL